MVVKVEKPNEWREFANVSENRFWSNNQHHEAIAKWLAPCEYISPDARILLQKRAQPLPDDYILPDKLPAFLTDIKRENFGLINGNLVCVDYAYWIDSPSTRLKPVNWG